LATAKTLVSAIIDNDTNKLQTIINGGFGAPYPTKNENLFLLPGHQDISDLDTQIALALKVSAGVPAVRNIPGALPKILQEVAKKYNFDYVLYDLSPNVGGLNEVLLMSSDYFIIPASPDYFCWQAVLSLSKRIPQWKREISIYKESNSFDNDGYSIKNKPLFIGMIQQKYKIYRKGPAASFENWITKIRESVNDSLVPELKKISCVVDEIKLKDTLGSSGLTPYDLAQISDFNSLIAISQDNAKPVFALTDSEIGRQGSVQSTMTASRDRFLTVFGDLAERVIKLTT
jgi:hypothetical protein